MLSRTNTDPQFDAVLDRSLRVGTITLILGCMFSGKTTELIRRIRMLPPDRVAAFKHAIDQRYRPDCLITHGGDNVPCAPVTSTAEVIKRLNPRIQTVVIDEAHFFSEQIVAFSREMAARGLCVVITALDLDSWGRPFPVIETLRGIADQVHIQKAACAKCAAPADHTQRLTPIVDGNLVGGPESYEPRCATCWQAPPEPPPANAG